MSTALACDEDLIRRLPLPLAQLHRRAHNAKTPHDRHDNAYYLAEAALKLAAGLRIGLVRVTGLEQRSPLAQALEHLCLPSIGHWVGFLRETSKHLSQRPDAALLPLYESHDALLSHTALPAVRAFAEHISRAEPGQHPPLNPEQAREAIRQGVMGFFNLVAGYRNQVFGHAGSSLTSEVSSASS